MVRIQMDYSYFTKIINLVEDNIFVLGLNLYICKFQVTKLFRLLLTSVQLLQRTRTIHHIEHGLNHQHEFHMFQLSNLLLNLKATLHPIGTCHT